jgi:hypothetical protein
VGRPRSADGRVLQPLVALASLVIVFFGVGVSGKAIIIFLLWCSPSSMQAGVRPSTPADQRGAFAWRRREGPLF